MNKEDIIRMAREAEFHPIAGGIVEGNLLRFAALVASAERERIKQANAPEIERVNAHIKELEDACKKPEQEPVAWYRDEDGIRIYYETKCWDDAIPLYTAPQPWEKFCDSNCVWTDHHPDCKLAEQEPVAWRHKQFFETQEGWFYADWHSDGINPPSAELLYTTPPQRKPLTDEEIILIVADCASSHQHTDIHFARAIEAAHGIKRLV